MAKKYLSELGEKNIIRELIRPLPILKNRPLPLNDDAQIIPSLFGGEHVISTDRTPSDLRALVWGIMSYREYGRYCVMSNMSDVAAMGAEPTGFLLNIGARGDTEIAVLKEILGGVSDALNEIDCPLLGGDTKEASELSLVGVGLGQLNNSRPLTRSSAKPGDVVAMSPGPLGFPPAAFEYFGKFKPNGVLLDSVSEETLRKSIVDIKANFYESRKLSLFEDCNTCMDNTDGILMSAKEIAEASNVDIHIDISGVYIDPLIQKIVDLGDRSLSNLILAGGADFKLMATFPSENTIPLGYTLIGKVSEGKGNVYSDDVDLIGNDFSHGWVHFSGGEEK